MASQEDTQEGDAKAQLLAEAFQKEGLDAGYWLPKLSQILGIKCNEALQHLEYEDYLKLECEVRYPWEKKALQKLLKITDDKTASKELQNKLMEKTKQRQEVAKQALKDLTEMLNSRSHSQDALRKEAETLWQAMENPKEFWPSPKEPLAEMLESIHKQLEQQQEMSAGRREKIPDTEVLRRASGGLALQGIYRTSRAGDVLATREQLLRVPEGFQLAGPEQGSVLERREFSSSAAESTFTKSMEKLGRSISVSGKFAFWGINLGVGVDHSSSSQSQDTHQSHSEQSYFCTTKFQYIPLASCYFQRHQLHLSHAALRELQDMEQILGVTGKEDNPTFVKMCESFFSRFGSHMNQGPLHFGGIFWWKASTEGFREEMREEVKRQTSAALNSFVEASGGGFGASGGGILDVSQSKSKPFVQGSARESSETKFQLYVENTGGPADAASLPQWKTGLVSDNTTWYVIDRGFELIPVWDVILCNHSGDFESVGQMSRALRDAYRVLTNESVETVFGEELGSAVQEARDFMETVKATEIEAAREEYVDMKEQDADRAEASLLLTGLTVTPERQKLSPEQKRERLVFIEDCIEGVWSTRIKNLLQKNRAGIDWERLEQDLHSLISGCLDDRWDEQKMQNILTDLKETFANPEPPSESQSKSDSSQSKANEAIAIQEFLQLLKRLGLESHYPRKMGMGDLYTICQTSLQDSQPRKDKELPLYFLQKLLTVDYQVRYLTCRDKNSPSLTPMPQSREQKGQHSDSFENLHDNLAGAAPECATRVGHVHPMDLQMAIFHCADDFLRQTLATKLAFCQLALPLLLPNPGTSQIEFPLYALSQIQRSWKEAEKSGKQTQTKSYNNKLIFQAQTPIVSFIRIGSSASSSKSQLLNALLSKRKHDTFFHRHCRGSTRERLLMEGVVEIAWYCPRGSPDDTFESCVAFCNLHGDARDHGAQLQFLQDISAVKVALVSDLEQMDNRGKKLLQNLNQSQRPLICLLTEKENIATGQSGKTITIGMKNRNEAELMDQLIKIIRDLLEGSNPCFSLDANADKAHHHGFLVDADKPACLTAKAKAKELVDLLKTAKLTEIKSQLPLLQADVLFEWCKKDKELTRLQKKGKRINKLFRATIENQRAKIILEQVVLIIFLMPLIQSFRSFLQVQAADTKKYFLQWINVFMDELSWSHFEELTRYYQKMQTELQSAKKSLEETKENNPLLNQLDAIVDVINNSSIGLEHLLREVGHFYEVLGHEKDDYANLPEIAAELMVLGYPVELMDGDASYLPLRWVGAIFDSLIERLGDKRVFVLSVLGIQSTGKSTLLNAMFGLQFNISAGRCTRGAFMQLIPVGQELQQDLGFDFVLVVDTEGLRTIKMANKQFVNHDMELVTFVIGVGNLTVINIFGENPSEMQDVLQIAVQAFLRMKKVNLSPSCIFVHQNVGEAIAKEQNTEGQRRLQEKLDEMTRVAAQQEFCDISSFSDVIGLDMKTHIHYLAHLWEGDHPMAPPNPTYSQNVQQLKSKILQAAKQQSQHILTLSSLKDRIGDLWDALLSENFVFSFKNSL